MNDSDSYSDESEIFDRDSSYQSSLSTLPISPTYESDLDLEEEEEHSETASSSNQSVEHHNTNSNIEFFEDSDESDEDFDMPTTRRSVRLSRASSLNSTNSSGAGPSSHDNSRFSDSTDDTEEYNVSHSVMEQGNSQIIEITDTQILETPPAPAQAVIEEDDDVILIPENIETIDLCTQIQPTPRAFRIPLRAGEVIEIEDSPLTQHPPEAAARQGPMRNNRGRANVRTSPYQNPAPSASKSTAKRLNLDDSLGEGATQSVKISCPICLESVIGRQPSSTICGHIFCKPCIIACIQTSKKCPMCKKTLKVANVHSIFLGV